MVCSVTEAIRISSRKIIVVRIVRSFFRIRDGFILGGGFVERRRECLLKDR